MAKPATGRAPKVYAADLDGVHEWIVAAPNQRAALDALGVHQDLFAQGKAAVEHDPVKVEAARDQPGVPLRRVRNSDDDFEPAGADNGGAWAAALEAAPRAPKSAVPAKPSRSAKSEPTADRSPKPNKPAKPAGAPARKGPSAAERMAVRAADAELRTFEREAVKVTAALDAEQAEMERRRRKLERDQDRRRAALEKAIEKARAVVEA